MRHRRQSQIVHWTLTFLGTSGAVPTTERNPSGIFLRRDGERFLFDIGEGTQRQMMHFSTGFKISAIFFTHLHGQPDDRNGENVSAE